MKESGLPLRILGRKLGGVHVSRQRGPPWTHGMTAFAVAYADQTKRDYRQLVDALASGLSPSAPGW
jgi:hypothetical protein